MPTSAHDLREVTQYAYFITRRFRSDREIAIFFLPRAFSEKEKLTAEPTAVVTETGLEVLSFHVMHRQRSDQETRRDAPSPNAIRVEERLLLHPEVLKPETHVRNACVSWRKICNPVFLL